MSNAADQGEEAMDASEWERVGAYLRAHALTLKRDVALLHDLGLAPANVVEFNPPTLAKLESDRRREIAARQAIEAVAEANFKTQGQIQASVLDLLESRNHADLARRIDEGARRHFELAAATAALEGPERVPMGWRELPPGCVDDLLGEGRPARLGSARGFERLFRAAEVRSMAIVRLSIWEPGRQGFVAYGSADPEHFTPAMGLELLTYLARVVERTAERWPVL